MTSKTTITAFATSIVLASAAFWAPAALAHVTVQPAEATAGGFTRLDVRVPTERDDAGTTRVAVKMPPGIFFASYEPRPGWTVQIKRRKLDQPVEVFGEEQSEEVDTVTFRAQGDDAEIGPGEFADFGLSVNVPDGDAGTKLTFPSTQTYSNGEVVRWIGPEDADEPAPVVTLAAAEGEATDSHGGEEGAAAGEQASGVTAEEVDDKASQGLAIAALIVGGLGLVAGIAGIAASRRRA